MSFLEYVGLVSGILSILGFGSAGFMAFAATTKRWREATIRELNASSFGSTSLVQLAGAWASAYESYFGKKLFSARQLITVPLYTFFASIVYVIPWTLYHIDGHISQLFDVHYDLVRYSLRAFFTEGIYVALVVDFAAIFLTKLAIRRGRTKGFGSGSFALQFVLVVCVSFFLFTFGLHFLRVLDMVRLNLAVVPHDVLTPPPYAPFQGLRVLVQLFEQPTFMYVTSKGLISTYFMPEPLLFYTAATSQISLVFIVVAHGVARFVDFVKTTSVKTLQLAGTQHGGARGVFVAMLLFMLAVTIVLVGLALYLVK